MSYVWHCIVLCERGGVIILLDLFCLFTLDVGLRVVRVRRCSVCWGGLQGKRWT
jgi:hypothetical protein